MSDQQVLSGEDVRAQDDLTLDAAAGDGYDQPDSEPSAEQERSWDEQYDGTSLSA